VEEPAKRGSGKRQSLKSATDLGKHGENRYKFIGGSPKSRKEGEAGTF